MARNTQIQSTLVENQTSPAQRARRTRFYVTVRIQDYRLSALAPIDPEDPEGEQDWNDIGATTTISANREGMFQLARSHDGLLLLADSLPSLVRAEAFAMKLASMKEEGGDTETERPKTLRLDSIKAQPAGAGAASAGDGEARPF